MFPSEVQDRRLGESNHRGTARLPRAASPKVFAQGRSRPLVTEAYRSESMSTVVVRKQSDGGVPAPKAAEAVATMWRGSMTFETPMLWAVGFIFVFTIGGFTGLILGMAPIDVQVNDTYYVVAHFHYVLVAGSLFAMFGGVYYWGPKWTARYGARSISGLR